MVKLSLLTGVPLFNSLVLSEPVKSGLRNLVSKLETLFYRMVQNISRYI